MAADLAVVIVAGGSARRFGGGNKLLLELAGLPLFLHSVKTFLPLTAPGCLVVVHPADAGAEFRAAAERFLPEAPIIWTAGGVCRCASVRAGLAALPLERGIVAVHDAARPLASAALLEALVEEARRTGGAIPGKPVADTLKRSDASGLIAGTVDRSGLWRVETPQVFDLALLRAAYARFPEGDFTDDAGVMAAAGYACRIVHNPDDNLKITYPGDLELLARRIQETRR